MITFLPADYKEPKLSSHYMRLQPGENKFRILSKPVTGWETWLDKKPVRFPMDKKPETIDTDNAPKVFWAFVVWNYAEKQIQILNVTQASVRKSIMAYCNDADWGAPFFYDIKVTKKGENMNTEYLVTALPHKPITEDIIKAYHTKPCCLEALFTGADPFSHLSDSFTPGVFTKAPELEMKVIDVGIKQVGVDRITAEQAQHLIDVLFECDEPYKKETWAYWKETFKITAIEQLPASMYEKVLKGAMNRIEENVKKENNQGRRK